MTSHRTAETPDAATLRLALEAMGTRFELVLPEVPRNAAGEAQLRAAGEAALTEVRAVEARWSLFRRDSFLSHLTRAAGVGPVRLDEDDYELLATARRVFELSGGAFDPCIAPRMARAGFARPDEVARAARGTFADVALDARARTVRFGVPGLALDLGGIAKGHALDRAARVLDECGVRTALLHGGTSAVVALGAPWRVALGADAAAPIATLRDAVLAISALDGRRNARGAGHVLDPRAAADVQHVRLTEASAIALGRDADEAPAAFADALATALLVTGTPLSLNDAGNVTQAHRPRGGAWRVAAGGPPWIRLCAPSRATMNQP